MPAVLAGTGLGLAAGNRMSVPALRVTAVAMLVLMAAQSILHPWIFPPNVDVPPDPATMPADGPATTGNGTQ